jgi:hypothetical protein
VHFSHIKKCCLFIIIKVKGGIYLISAITTLVANTIDLFLKINSSESRKRKFSKDLFTIYKSLEEVMNELNNIEFIIKYINLINKKKTVKNLEINFDGLNSTPSILFIRSIYDEFVEYQILSHNNKGLEIMSNPIKVKKEELLKLLLYKNVRSLTKTFTKIAKVMRAQSWELFQLQFKPELLKKLEIYDPTIVKTFTKAWFDDGGFVEALDRFGFKYELGGELELIDYKFDPSENIEGYNIEPNTEIYNFSDTSQTKKFFKKINLCKVSVEKAYNSTKHFISRNCPIEYIL